MIFLDPQGDGQIPVKKYQELADKYNSILIGSLQSKNGMSYPEQKQILDGLIKWTGDYFSPEKHKVYIAGFSGGARVAVTYCYNQAHRAAGAIACGALAAQNVGFMNYPVPLLVFCGYNDFNFAEVYSLTRETEGDLSYVFFEGGHEWPDLNSFICAFDFFQQPEVVQSYPDDSVAARKDSINKGSGCANMNGTVAVSDRTLHKEEMERNLLTGFFQTGNTRLIRQKVERLNRKLESATHPDTLHHYNRIRNFLSLITYLYSDQLIKSRRYNIAKEFLDIYQMVDPDNPEVYYLKACVAIADGQQDQAMELLNQSVSTGFSDTYRLVHEKAFSYLQGNGVFQEIVMRLPLPPVPDTLHSNSNQ